MPTDKADLSLRSAHRSFCWFCHEAAHMKIKSLQQSIESVFFFFFLFHYVDTDKRSDLALQYFPMVYNSKT